MSVHIQDVVQNSLELLDFRCHPQDFYRRQELLYCSKPWVHPVKSPQKEGIPTFKYATGQFCNGIIEFKNFHTF